MSKLNPKFADLNRIAQVHYGDYVKAKPFPHIYFDDFFDSSFLEQVLSEFPNMNHAAEDIYHDDNQRKKRTLSTYEKMQPSSQLMIDFLNSAIFLNFLQRLTGIREQLIPDPSMEGGGFHETLSGGFLKLHVDFNKHFRTNLDRRINVIIFLNKGWQEEYGGDIELWDETLKLYSFKAKPLFNRIVIFNTTSTSYHGQPDVLNCPEYISRKSIATYYYSHGRPQEEIIDGLEVHSTRFRGRTPMEIKNAEKALRRYKRKQIFWAMIPPIVFQIRRKILKIIS